MNDALALLVDADTTLDAATDAPKNYALALVAMVAEGYADRMPMGVKGKPTAEVREAKAEVAQAYKAKGVTATAALRQRILRLTYALHILAANPAKDGETEEALVKRVSAIRQVANSNDLDAIGKAITGSTEKAKRGPKSSPKAPKATKAPEAPEAPEAPKVLTLDEAHNKLMTALSDCMTTVEAHKAAGGRITKAMSTAQQTKIAALLALYAA